MLAVILVGVGVRNKSLALEVNGKLIVNTTQII